MQKTSRAYSECKTYGGVNKIVKYKATYSKDKETKWLNQMADEGWAMTGFFAGFYKFEKCEPKKWRYEIDFCEKSGYVSNDYREFMSEAGIEIVQCSATRIPLMN